MTDPGPVMGMIDSAAQLAQRRAGWELLTGALNTFDATSATAQVTIDNDSESTIAISMLGMVIPEGTRVFLLRVPPSGVYIIGWAATVN